MLLGQWGLKKRLPWPPLLLRYVESWMISNHPRVMSEDRLRKWHWYMTHPNLCLKEGPECEFGYDPLGGWTLNIETQRTKLLKPLYMTETSLKFYILASLNTRTLRPKNKFGFEAFVTVTTFPSGLTSSNAVNVSIAKPYWLVFHEYSATYNQPFLARNPWINKQTSSPSNTPDVRFPARLKGRVDVVPGQASTNISRLKI